ncbi:hypothetical protein [Sulfurovum lithotrophicum]|nr:hypothetical protein [Sulfurovum lithotrophicum]
MKILLINFNPVVSRLFALCTRDEHIELDEVKDIKDIEEYKDYDLAFVDDASYADAVREFIENHRSMGKKVFISYGQESVHGFDMTLKKPFLPSQILEVMQSVEVREEKQEVEEEPVIFPLENEEDIPVGEVEGNEVPSIFPLSSGEIEEELEEAQEEAKKEILPESPHILDSKEIEKIKNLLDMEEEEESLPTEEELPDEVVEQRKVNAIKAQLIADGLEIVEEGEIVEALGTGKKSKKKKKRVETGPFSKDEFAAIQKAFTDELLKLKPKKIKKLLKGKEIEVKLKLKDQD